jgi:hypothetical protein
VQLLDVLATKPMLQNLTYLLTSNYYAKEREITMDEKALGTLTVVRRIASFALHRRFKISIASTQRTLIISVLAIAALLSACSSSTPTATNVPQQPAASSTPNPTATPNPTFTPNPTSTPSQTVAPAGTSTPQQAAKPTALDPCQLIPSQEASSLAGTSFGAGVEGTTSGGLKTCTYGSQTTIVFTVQVVQAPDTATADAAKQQFLSDLQANLQQLSSEGLNVTQLPNFADGAVIAQASIKAGGETFNGSAIGFRKGTIFFGFSDVALGSAAPDSAALQSEATTVLGRLP